MNTEKYNISEQLSDDKRSDNIKKIIERIGTKKFIQLKHKLNQIESKHKIVTDRIHLC